MRSTGVISTSDYPFLGPFWQGLDKKQHPVFGERPFQACIGCNVCSIGPEISTNCNDTAGGLRKGRQEAVSSECQSDVLESRSGKTLDRGMPECPARPGPAGAVERRNVQRKKKSEEMNPL